jgi:WD40 repeat protein
MVGEMDTDFPVNCLEVGVSGPPDVTAWRPVSSKQARADKVTLIEDYLIFSACGNDIFCWKMGNTKPIKKYQYHNGTVLSITLFGDRLFSSSNDKQIAIWDRDVRLR